MSLSLIVTFDRIDPFNTLLGEPSTGEISDRSWIVTLPDLLLVADLLPSSAEFFTYVRTRVEMVRADSHRVIVEADVLGAWCKDRLTKCKSIFPGTFALIDKTSTEINDYYAFDTAVSDSGESPALRHELQRPTSGVPTVVLESLERLLEAQDVRWVERCKQAFDVRPVDWKQFKVRLELARNPDIAKGRTSRKKLAQARRGFVVAESLPVRFDADDAASSDDFLIIRP